MMMTMMMNDLCDITLVK